jgi:hypothetical protein
LLGEDQDRDAVGEPDRHGIRDHVDILADLQEPVADLENSGNNACGKESLWSTILDIDGRQDDGHSAGGAGDLLCSAAEKRGKDSGKDGAVESCDGSPRVAIEGKDAKAESERKGNDGRGQAAKEIALEMLQREAKILAEAVLFNVTLESSFEIASARVQIFSPLLNCN